MQFQLILGNQAYSSWSLRGWLLFKAFDIDCQHEVVPLYTPEFNRFLESHYPANTVPALHIGGTDDVVTIWDSLAIAEFLHEQYPTAGIWPVNAVPRAAARSLCAEMHSNFFALRASMPMNVRKLYRSFVPNDDAQADIDRITELWAWAHSRWGASGPYLFGKHFCAADAFFTPVASRFRTYNVSLSGFANSYVETLLDHPASVEFYRAGRDEIWILDQCEMDVD